MPKPPPNQPPAVDAGLDQTIQLPSTATLNGIVTDDGFPRGKKLTQKWEKLNGPGTVTFGDSAKAKTSAAFSTAGEYTLRLTADDGSLCTAQSVIIHVLGVGTIPVTEPTLPLATVNTTYIARTGPTVHVPSGGDLQTAINNAQPGSRITLEPGATYVGPFTLPVKFGGNYVYLETQGFSTPGRLSPSATPLAKIITSSGAPAIMALVSSNFYRFIGIEFSAPGRYIDTLLSLGDGNEASLSAQPHHIIIDRCYVHGDPTFGGKRGVGFQGQHLAVVDSYLKDWKGQGQDTQAICGWNGAGPFKIDNSYVEGAGENIMFGGADAQIANLTPSDIEITNNHIFKPLALQGSIWTVKNSLELKHARRVLIEGNLIENCFAGGQAGFAVVFTARNENGTNPWATVSDVTFRSNVIKNSANGVNLLGIDHQSGISTQPSKRVLIEWNLFREIGGQGAGDGILFQIIDGYEDVHIDHNTALHTGTVIVSDYAPSPRMRYTNNICQHNAYGILGSSVGSGNPALAQYFPNSVVTKNVFQSGTDYASIYPAGNYFPATLGDIGFLNYPTDLHLAPSSPYAGQGTDGEDIGY